MSTERTNGEKPPREPISITDKRRVDPETGQVRAHALAPPGRRRPEPVRRRWEEGRARRGSSSGADRRSAKTAGRVRKLPAAGRTRSAGHGRDHEGFRSGKVPRDPRRPRPGTQPRRPRARTTARYLVKIRATLADLGVAAFGEEGDPFDPTLHEAVQHEGDGHELVVGSVLRRGYKFGDRKVLRTAMVTVVDAHRS